MSDDKLEDELRAEVRRLRTLLQWAADENDGAPSSHCCYHCIWCNGRKPVGDRFVHADDCKAYTPQGQVK